MLLLTDDVVLAEELEESTLTDFLSVFYIDLSAPYMLYQLLILSHAVPVGQIVSNQELVV